MTAEPKVDQALADELEGFFDPNDNRHNAQQPFDETNQDQPLNEHYQGEQIWAETENTSKHWLRSKTMWFNIGVTAVGVSQAVLPFAQPFVNPRIFGLLTTGIGIANMALRAATSDEIRGND